MKITNSSNPYQHQFYNKNVNTTISFKGLTGKLSKAVYDKETVVELCKKYEEKSHWIVGKLPVQWISAIPFEKRPQTIKDVLENFGFIFAKLRGVEDYSSAFSKFRKKAITRKSQKQAEKNITTLLRKNGILKWWQKARIKYIGSGDYAYVYRLDVKKDRFAVKVFKNVFQPKWDYAPNHGNLFEQPVAQYMKKKIPKRNNNWLNFYFGDLKNGIMLSRFEDNKHKFNKRPYDTEKIGISIDGCEHYADRNNVNGKIVDIGGVDILEQAKNKTFRYIYSQTMKDTSAPLKILEETIGWKSSPIYNERLKGVFNILPILPEEDAKKCLDLILSAANKEISQHIAENIFMAPLSLRKNIFYSLYSNNDINLDIALSKKLECLEAPVSEQSEFVKALKKRNNKEINKVISELY